MDTTKSIDKQEENSISSLNNKSKSLLDIKRFQDQLKNIDVDMIQRTYPDPDPSLTEKLQAEAVQLLRNIVNILMKKPMPKPDSSLTKQI